MLIASIVLFPSAAVLLLNIGMARVSAHSDRAADESLRGLLLRELARRVGERRGGDRRRRGDPVATDRRLGDRRIAERRVEPLGVDLPAAIEVAPPLVDGPPRFSTPM